MVISEKCLQKYLLYIILIMTVFKFSLIGIGFQALPDEGRYFSSIKVWDQLVHLKVRSAFGLLFSIEGRPGDALIKIIPSILQTKSASLLGLKFSESKNTFPLFLYNFIAQLSLI
jgi:hypothetical protein